VHTEPSIAFTPSEAYDKNLTFRTGRCPARALVERMIPLVRRRPELTSVISHRLPLEQGAEGYELFDRKRDRCTKVVLRA
jgi:threonine dehydrogenase-like Zn-dependent dehydrogenase